MSSITAGHLKGLELALGLVRKYPRTALSAIQDAIHVAKAKSAAIAPAAHGEHPERCGCSPAGTEQVSSAWLAQLREEYRQYAEECERLRGELQHREKLIGDLQAAWNAALEATQLLRNELHYVRQQQPVAWMHSRTGTVATMEAKVMMEEGSVASGYEIPLFRHPPAADDTAIVPMGLLGQVERFVSGFEDDQDQAGVPELLAAIRAAQAGEA